MLLSGWLEGLVVMCACLLHFPVSLTLLRGWLEGLVVRHAHIHTHTGTCTHEHTAYTKFKLHDLKQAANIDLRWMKTVAQSRKYGRSIVLGKKCFQVTLL